MNGLRITRYAIKVTRRDGTTAWAGSKSWHVNGFQAAKLFVRLGDANTRAKRMGGEVVPVECEAKAV